VVTSGYPGATRKEKKKKKRKEKKEEFFPSIPREFQMKNHEPGVPEDGHNSQHTEW